MRAENVPRKLRRPIDLTCGQPWKQILRFMLPMLLGNIVQQLYNTADSAIVGRYVGDSALAAVGSAGSILNLLIVLLVGVSTGAGIVVSQYQGAKSRRDIEETVGNCLILTGIATLIVMTSSLFLIRPLLALLRTPQSIIDSCGTYLRILLLGSVGMAYYNMLSGVLRGLGDSFSALIYLLFACGLNIVLDLFFVARLDMGIRGAALATIIAQIASALLCLMRLMRMKEYLDLTLRSLHWDWRYGKRIIQLGIPSGLTQVVMSMSWLLVQALINNFGEMLVTTNVIISRVDGFVVLPALSFGSAMTTYAGQNMGSGEMERVRRGLRQSIYIAAGIAVLVTVLLLACGRPIMRLFTRTQEIIALGYQLMCILAPGYILFFITQCLCGTMSGMGRPMATMKVSFLATFAVRLPLAWLMVVLSKSPQYPQGRPEALYLSQLCAWLFGTVYSILLYRKLLREDCAIHEYKEVL